MQASTCIIISLSQRPHTDNFSQHRASDCKDVSGTPTLESTVGEVLEGTVTTLLTPTLCRLSTHLVRRRLASTQTQGFSSSLPDDR